MSSLQGDFDRNLPNFFDGLEIGDTTLGDGRRIVLFTSKTSLKFLARSDCIAMDGTFKITPSPWKQVGIISAEISEQCWIPIAFGLLISSTWALISNGEYHELVQWPNDHDCAPSATSYLARIFVERCYNAVEFDPTKSIFQIYKDVRADLGKDLTEDEKISFLCEIPRLHSIKVQLYKHRRNFIPKAPQKFVSKIYYRL